MAEDKPSPWKQPSVWIPVAVIVLGWASTFSLNNYRLNQLEEKVKGYEVLATDVSDTYSLVEQIAEKMGITVPKRKR